MDTRYAHPEVTKLYSLNWTYDTWLAVEVATLRAQLAIEEHPVTRLGGKEALNLLSILTTGAEVDGFPDPDGAGIPVPSLAVHTIRLVEKRTQHDVVAFLEWLRESVGHPGQAKWLHWGLTSSDVVDTTQGLRFARLHRVLLNELEGLVSELTRLTLSDEPLLARTHGQVAEPTTLRVRAHNWLGNLATFLPLVSRSCSALSTCKLSGPVGTYAHNPPSVEARVAEQLNLRPHGQGASQVALRAPLAAWASAAAGVVEACHAIAVDVRLMKLTGEGRSDLKPGQVGSSAMPHKNNPIKEEKLGGLVRLARGYAQALQPLDLWLERDLSNSSVERVAVPDLWHVLLHAVQTTRSFLAAFWVDEDLVFQDYLHHGPNLLTSTLTLDNLPGADSWQDARAKALDANLTAVPETALHFVRNYPGGAPK